jgi:hypothetical protein
MILKTDALRDQEARCGCESLGLSAFLAVPEAAFSSSSVPWDGQAKRNGGPTPMLDAVFVLVSIAFFVVSIGYVAGCDRLK